MAEAVLLDLSGVLYVGARPLEGAREALEGIRRLGLPLKFVTNTTRSSRDQLHAMLGRLGFTVGADELFTAPMAARAYLERRGLQPLLLVHPAVRPEFADLEGPRCNAVLVGDAGEEFNHHNLNRAFRCLMEGAPLIAMGRNRYFQEEEGLSLDAGPFITALEYAADVSAVVTGKPSEAFFHAACRALDCEPGRALMVGDDVEADVNGAVAAGLRAVLVRSGKYRPGDEDRLQGPDALVLPDIAAVAQWLAERAG